MQLKEEMEAKEKENRANSCEVTRKNNRQVQCTNRVKTWTKSRIRAKSQERGRKVTARRRRDANARREGELERTDMWDTMGRKLRPSRRQSLCVARLSLRADRIRVGSIDRLGENRPSLQKQK